MKGLEKKENKLIILLILSLLIIGIIVTINISSFNNIEKIYINQVTRSQIIKTDHVGHQIKNHILRVKNQLVTLSKFPNMDSLNIDQCTKLVKKIQENLDDLTYSLLKTTETGDVSECSNNQFEDYIGINIKDKNYFKIPKKTDEPYISKVVIQGKTRHIIISAPLFKTTEYTPYPNYKGNFKGVLFSIMDLETLFNLQLHPVITKNELFVLYDPESNETILKSEEFKNYQELMPKIISSAKIDIIKNLKTYGPTIVTFSHINLGNDKWNLVLLTPINKIKKEFSGVQNRHFFSILFVILVSITTFFGYIKLYKAKEETESKLKKTHMTLEKLGINIQTEKDVYTPADIKLKSEQMYFISEDAEGQAFDLFIDCLNRGFAGLGLIRENPEIIKEKYGLKNTSFIWLSKESSNNKFNETNIQNLSNIISEFIKKSESSVILIDRLDYLYSLNTSEKVNKEIFKLKDLVTTHKALILLSANQDLLKKEDLKLIQTEAIDLFGANLKKSIDLSETELEMLRFINEKNLENKLVSYKDITNKFNITKPTTRSKINKLHSNNLLFIEQRGRFKSLKITSSGRRFLN